MWTKPTPAKRRLATEPNSVAKQANAAPSSDEPNRAETEEIVRALCTQFQRLETTQDNKLGVSVCSEFQQSVQLLVQCAAMSLQQPILRIAMAMDALMNELPPQPSQFRLGTLRLAVDVLEALIKHPELTPKASCDSAAVVVDPSRGSSTCNALRNVGFQPISFLDAREAL